MAVDQLSDAEGSTGGMYSRMWDGRVEWKAAFEAERARLESQSRERDLLQKRLEKNLSEEDRVECEDLLGKIEEKDWDADLPPPTNWPIGGGQEGIPMLNLLMQVDAPESIKYCRDFVTYRQYMQSLPARVQAEMAAMYNEKDDQGVPLDVMLPEGKNLSHGYDRQRQYDSVQEAMLQFHPAGCMLSFWHRQMQYLRTLQDPVERVSSLECYLCQVLKQVGCPRRGAPNRMRWRGYGSALVEVEGMCLDGSFHSESIRSANDYVRQGNLTVCPDLYKLVEDVIGPELNAPRQMEKGNTQSPHFWQSQTSSMQQFMVYMNAMIGNYNSSYVNLLPQNLYIATQHQISSICYRLGGHNNGFMWIGMLTIIADGGLKYMCRGHQGVPVLETRKSPSAGVDLVREYLDFWRLMGSAYLGLGQPPDKQPFEQMKRASELALARGAVLEIKNEIKQMPGNELAQDTMATEGLSTRLEVYNQLVNFIPRDGRMDASMVTTVDPDKTNVRAMATYRLIVGFSIYLICLCKNNFFEKAVEERFRDLSVVCFVQYTQGLPDMDGVTRLLRPQEDSFDSAEQVYDAGQRFRAGASGNAAGAKGKKKGDQPTDLATQKKWAPLLFYTYAMAGSVVGIANKVGVFSMEVNYHVKHVADHIYKCLGIDLMCLISETDLANMSRYFEALKCRAAGETVLISTLRGMLGPAEAEGWKLSDAAAHATRALCFNAIDISLLPSLFDRLLQRMIRFEPILGIATVGLCLEIPVIPLQSMIHFLRGQTQAVPPQDLSMLKDFCQKCWRDSMFMNEGTLNGDACHSHGSYPIPYITSKGAWTGDGACASMLRERVVMANDGRPVTNTADKPLEAIGRKVYMHNGSALKSCAFVKEPYTFQRCLQALLQPYDMRQFFGGLDRLGDTKFLLQSLGLPFANKFKDGFAHVQADGVDPMIEVGRIDTEIFCCGVRIWDALLFFSICCRPRRDSSLLDDFCKTLVQYQMDKLPKRLFPYTHTVANKTDAVTERQVVYEMDPDRAHEVLVRPRNKHIFGAKKLSVCPGHLRSGVLEDEAHMAPFVGIAKALGLRAGDLPLDKLNLPMPVECNRFFSFTRYPNNTLVHKEIPSCVGEVVVFFNRFNARLCVCYWPEQDWPAVDQHLAPWSGGWQCPPPKVHELPIHGLTGTFDEAMRWVYLAGFGPRPMFDRCGVGVCMESPDGSKYVGCIVRHDWEREGGRCQCSRSRTCYFCPLHPFYTVLKEEGDQVFHCSPKWVDERVIPFGTRLALDIACPDFRDKVRPEQLQTSRVYAADPVEEIAFDQYGTPVDQAVRGAQQRREGGSVKYLEVRLDAPNTYTPVQGKLRVTFAATPIYSRNTEDSRSLYVSPQHLYFYEDVAADEIQGGIMLIPEGSVM